MKFNNSFMTTVPTAALVEDFQALTIALRNYNRGLIDIEAFKDEVQSVIDCLGTTISHDSTSIGNVTPSGFSIIMPERLSGLYLNDDETEIFCMGGKPVSDCLHNNCVQCPDDCKYKSQGCSPDEFQIFLECGLRYDGSEDSNIALQNMMELD